MLYSSQDTIYTYNYIDPIGTDYLFSIYTNKCIDSLGMHPMDLSISETELKQTSVPSGSGLLPVLLHRHSGNAHDWQLHSLQLPPMHPWFLLH